jgi:hypothetical protein
MSSENKILYATILTASCAIVSTYYNYKVYDIISTEKKKPIALEVGSYLDKPSPRHRYRYGR